MNRNTMLAFFLIFASAFIFLNPGFQKFYFTKILRQPYPENIAPDKKVKGGDSAAAAHQAVVQGTDTLKNPEEKTPSAAGKTTTPADTAEKQPGDTIWVETEKMIAGISEIGARIVSLQMKEYKLDHHLSTAKGDSTVGRGGYVDLITKNSSGGAGLEINNDSYDSRRFSLENSPNGKRVRLKKGEQVTISLLSKDAAVKKQYSFQGDGYAVGLKILSEDLNNKRIQLSWLAGISESEKKAGYYQGEQRKAHFFDGQEVRHFRSTKPDKDDVSGFYRWIGVSSKYFFVAIVADTSRDADLKIIAIEDKKEDDKDGKKNNVKGINYQISYQLTGQGKDACFWIYAGPSKIRELKKADLKFEKILFPVLGWTKVFFWADQWFPWLAEFVLWMLLWLYGFCRDYGIAILLLTVLSRLITYPLTQSSMKSMNRMKDLQPKINALRQKYKSNPRKMNEEIMAFYKSEGVNPLNPGCLPMFLQMPVFIALFVVLGKAIELRSASTILVPWVKDLSQPESLFSLSGIIPGGIPFYGSNFALLPVVMAILTFFQNKMTIKDPNQKMMIYFMPIFMLVLFNNFPAGLVLYWTLSSALGLLQQYYLDKRKSRAAVKTEPSSISFKKR